MGQVGREVQDEEERGIKVRSIESIIHANSLLWAREHLRVEDLPTFKEC